MYLLTKKIETLETMINFYSDRDRVRTVELQNEVEKLKTKLLNQMTEDNNKWLRSLRVKRA